MPGLRARGRSDPRRGAVAPPDVRQQLMIQKDLCLAGRGECLVLYRYNELVSPDALAELIDRARRLSDTIAASAAGSPAPT